MTGPFLSQTNLYLAHKIRKYRGEEAVGRGGATHYCYGLLPSRPRPCRKVLHNLWSEFSTSRMSASGWPDAWCPPTVACALIDLFAMATVSVWHRGPWVEAFSLILPFLKPYVFNSRSQRAADCGAMCSSHYVGHEFIFHRGHFAASHSSRGETVAWFYILLTCAVQFINVPHTSIHISFCLKLLIADLLPICFF